MWTEPAYLHPNLHRSTAPLCSHAYALSSIGASHLLSLLNNPWTAFQTPIDTHLRNIISSSTPATSSLTSFDKPIWGQLTDEQRNQERPFNSFSIEPPWIIQNKKSKSDIGEGSGSPWRGVLMDSTLERIERAKTGQMRSKQIYDEELREQQRDPAIRFRYREKCKAS
jgi:hypothetical protein